MADALRRLAGAFLRTGNIQVSDELQAYANDLVGAVVEARNAYDDLNRESLSNARQLTGALLKATLNGCVVDGRPTP